MFELTDEQKAIVAHGEGPCVVMAVAGAAKTTTTLLRIDRLLTSGVKPVDVLLTTFSRLGASDMKRRSSSLGVRRGVEYKTIHSVAWRMARAAFPRWKLPPGWFARAVVRSALDVFAKAHPQAVRPTVEFASREEFMAAVFGGRKKEEEQVNAAAGITTRDVLSEIGVAKAYLIQPDSWSTSSGVQYPSYLDFAEANHRATMFAKAVDYCYRVLEASRSKPLETKAGKNLHGFAPEDEAFDHDDVILHVAKAILQNHDWTHAWRGRFGYVIVDEAQDTNVGQWAIVKHLTRTYERVDKGETFRWKNLMVVADDSQAIFAWRGAQPELLRDFVEEAGPTVSFYQLTTNFRSGQKILDAGNGVLRTVRGRLFDGELQCGRVGAAGHVDYQAFMSPQAEAASIVATIKDSIAAGRDPREIAVLYRINASSGLVEMALIREKIPYRVAGKSFFQRPDVVAALAYVALAVDDTDREAYEIAYRVPLRGLGREFLRRFPTLGDLRAASNTELGYRYVRGARKLLRAVHDVKHLAASGSNGLASAIRYVFEDVGVRDHFLLDVDSVGGEAGVGDSEVSDNEQDEAFSILLSCAKTVETPQALLEYAREMQNAKGGAVGCQDDEGERLCDKRVTLSTVHRIKGLEHEEVFVMGLSRGLFPLSRCEPVDETKLGYVAFTRAKDVLHLSCSGLGERPSPSRLLAAAGVVPASAVDDYDPLPDRVTMKA